MVGFADWGRREGDCIGRLWSEIGWGDLCAVAGRIL